MMTKGAWKGILAFLLVLAAAGALLGYGLGDMPLTDRDEGEYAASVAAMRASGNYVVPTLNGKLYLEKPILIFWAVAASEKILGPGEMAARLPSAASAWLLVLLTGVLVWIASGRPGLAALAMAALAFSPLYVLVGRACLTDSLLALFSTLALALFFWASQKEPPAGRKLYLLAWAALGLAFLTKGPVALAVVLPAAFIYAIFQGGLFTTLREARIHWGILIFILINLPWFGLAWYQVGDRLWQDFFVSQNLRRFSETLLGHGGGLVYYLPVLLLGAFPCSVAALPELGRSLFANPRALRKEDPLARLHLLSAIALLVVFVVFTLAATKQINYILPALPFLAVLAGCTLDRLSRGEEGGRLARLVFWGLLVVLGGILALALAAVPIGLNFFWDKILASIRFDSSEYALPVAAPLMILWPLLSAAAMAALVLAGLWLKRRNSWRLMPWAVGGLSAVFCALVFLGLLPGAAKVIQTPAKVMALEVKAKKSPESQVVTYGLWKPSLIYYLGQDLPRVRSDQGGELAKDLGQNRPVFVMTRTRLLPELQKLSGVRELAGFEGYLLVGNAAAEALWRPGAAPPAPKPAEAAQPQPEKPASPDAATPPPKEAAPQAGQAKPEQSQPAPAEPRGQPAAPEAGAQNPQDAAPAAEKKP